jgi:hypothetical protein
VAYICVEYHCDNLPISYRTPSASFTMVFTVNPKVFQQNRQPHDSLRGLYTIEYHFSPLLYTVISYRNTIDILLNTLYHSDNRKKPSIIADRAHCRPRYSLLCVCDRELLYYIRYRLN